MHRNTLSYAEFLEDQMLWMLTANGITWAFEQLITVTFDTKALNNNISKGTEVMLVGPLSTGL
jgi:hypothetical protein